MSWTEQYKRSYHSTHGCWDIFVQLKHLCKYCRYLKAPSNTSDKVHWGAWPIPGSVTLKWPLFKTPLGMDISPLDSSIFNGLPLEWLISVSTDRSWVSTSVQRCSTLHLISHHWSVNGYVCLYSVTSTHCDDVCGWCLYSWCLLSRQEDSFKYLIYCVCCTTVPQELDPLHVYYVLSYAPLQLLVCNHKRLWRHSFAVSLFPSCG